MIGQCRSFAINMPIFLSDNVLCEIPVLQSFVFSQCLLAFEPCGRATALERWVFDQKIATASPSKNRWGSSGKPMLTNSWQTLGQVSLSQAAKILPSRRGPGPAWVSRWQLLHRASCRARAQWQGFLLRAIPTIATQNSF